MMQVSLGKLKNLCSQNEKVLEEQLGFENRILVYDHVVDPL